MTPHHWIAAGAFVCAAAVIAGAFGAHGLASRLDAASLALWETAARYFVYTGFGLLAIGLTALHGGRADLGGAGWCLLVGGLIFSGTVAVLALGGPRWFGAITPLGGAAMIAGFVWLGVAVLRG